ncbi:MAG: hypothetical protein JSW51_07920 [Gemmatimonadota bacterium]|nr:MAG: hypothetical protein JSW51_07920 [Gemmatimonadota bacterium]
MLKKIKALPKLAAALALAAALTFGVAQALETADCTPGLPQTCSPNCTQLCAEYGYHFGGTCIQSVPCCLCLEK